MAEQSIPFKFHKRTDNNGKVESQDKKDDSLEEVRAKLKSYILPGDVQRLSDFARKAMLYIGVRKTGDDSIKRLAEGGACKPHSILDKSLKEGSVKPEFDKWQNIKKFLQAENKEWIPHPTTRITLTPRQRYEDRILLFDKPGDIRRNPQTFTAASDKKYRDCREVVTIFEGGADVSGLVAFVDDCFGHVYDGTKVKAVVSGFVAAWWGLEVETQGNATLSEVPSLNRPEITTARALPAATAWVVKVPVAVLRVGKKTAKIAPLYGREVWLDEIGDVGPADAYTGDYDLHELFMMGPQKAVDVGGSVLTHRSQTPEANRAANNPLAGPQVDELQSILVELTGALRRERKIDNAEPWTRTASDLGMTFDRYAMLIQHGPQSLYERFVLATNAAADAGEAPRKETLLKSLQEQRLTDSESAEIVDGAIAAAARWRDTREHLVASLTQPDTGGVVLFSPARDVYVMEGLKSVRDVYRAIAVEVTPDNSRWVTGVLRVGKNLPFGRITVKRLSGGALAVRKIKLTATPLERVPLVMWKYRYGQEGSLDLPAKEAPGGMTFTATFKREKGSKIAFVALEILLGSVKGEVQITIECASTEHFETPRKICNETVQVAGGKDQSVRYRIAYGFPEDLVNAQ